MNNGKKGCGCGGSSNGNGNGGNGYRYRGGNGNGDNLELPDWLTTKPSLREYSTHSGSDNISLKNISVSLPDGSITAV